MSAPHPIFLDVGNGLRILLGSHDIVTWVTATRPVNPEPGTLGFNTETNQIELWYESSWFTLPLSP